MSLQSAVPSAAVRLVLALVVGAVFAAMAGFIVGMPVLRHRGDYLAIVTLAAGEIIKGAYKLPYRRPRRERPAHHLQRLRREERDDLGLSGNGQGDNQGRERDGTQTIANFTAGFILIMLTLVIVLNLIHSRSGRAIAWRCATTRIAAESVGINITKYKLMAFVTSAALAGAAGALYGLNFQTSPRRNLTSTHPSSCWCSWCWADWATSGGSIVSAAVLTILRRLRRLQDAGVRGGADRL